MDSVCSEAGGPVAAPDDTFFECQFCDTVYRSLEAYTSHLDVHETLFEYGYSCTLCKRQFACRTELHLHSRLHSDLKPYKCKLCSQSFRLARSLEYHLMGHGSRRLFHCTMCEATFAALDDIHEHLRDHQMGRIAEAAAAATNDEVEAEAEEEREDKFVPLVETSFLDTVLQSDLHTNAAIDGGGVDGGSSALQTAIAVGVGVVADVAATAGVSHVKVESAGRVETTAVTTTNGDGGGGAEGMSVDENNEFDEEALFARAVNVKKTTCNLCNKKMATRKSLNTHYKSVHMKNAHTCSVCRTSFLFSRLLQEHTRRRKRIIPCEFCDLRFCSNKRWDSHIAKHRADSMGAPGGGVVMYPRAIPLSSTMARQAQQATISSAANPQRHSLLKNNNNNNNHSSRLNSSPTLIKTNQNSGGIGSQKATLSMGNNATTISPMAAEGGGNTIGKYPCDACGKIFLSLHYLQSHLVKRRNPNFQFQCDTCEHRFSKKAILEEHREYHDRMAAKKQQQLPNKQQVNGLATINRPSSNNKLVDNGIGSGQDEEMDFDRHIIRLPDASFKCNCCERTFKAVNHLKCHLRYTHMKKNFKCRSCNQQFPLYKVYLGHMKNSKLCERCDKRICVKFDFRIHTQKCRGTAKMRNSTGNIAVPKSNIVEIRDDDDDEEEDQEDEQENVELDDEDDAVIIDENGSRGGPMAALHSSMLLPGQLDDLMDPAAVASDYPPIPHFLMDDLIEPEEYKCEPCGKVFAKVTSLHMHSFQHDPNKELKCIFCNFLFLQRSSLNRHYRCRNTLHTCQVCKEAFCSHLSLRQHTCTDGMNGREFVDSATMVGGGGGGAAAAAASAVTGGGGVDDEYMELSELNGAEAMAVGLSRKRNRSGNPVSAASRLVVGVNSEDVSGRDESIELSDTEPDSLVCMMCTQEMATKAELDHHVATEHGTVTKCTICCKSFRSPTILHIHMAARASKKNKIECPSCPHRFNKQSEFRKHNMYHTMKQNRPETSDEAIYSRIATKYPFK